MNRTIEYIIEKSDIDEIEKTAILLILLEENNKFFLSPNNTSPFIGSVVLDMVVQLDHLPKLKEDIKLLLDEIYNVRVLMIIYKMLKKIIEKSSY